MVVWNLSILILLADMIYDFLFSHIVWVQVSTTSSIVLDKNKVNTSKAFSEYDHEIS